MSLLDSFPHTAVAKRRIRTKGPLGGSKDTLETLWSTARACWRQPAGDSEKSDFAKRGVTITNKVYFTANPELTAQHLLVVTDSDAGTEETFEVKSNSSPDASAGLGVLWRVMVERTTLGDTG